MAFKLYAEKNSSLSILKQSNINTTLLVLPTLHRDLAICSEY